MRTDAHAVTDTRLAESLNTVTDKIGARAGPVA